MLSLFILILLSSLLSLTASQQYPSCPGGAPLTLGNATDPYNFNIIQLSTFLSLSDQAFISAFQAYLSTGSQTQVNQLINKNKTFYIILTTLLTFVSLVLFVLLVRIGDIKFSDKEKFQKIKENGFTSPLSAFFTLVAVALLIFTCFNAYLIPSMLESLKMTECRLDALNDALLSGSSHYSWDGVSRFSQKLGLIMNLTTNLKNQMSLSNFTELFNLTTLAEVYLLKAKSINNGVEDQYSNAEIVYNQMNASQNVALGTLIPYLFSNSNNGSFIFGDLQKYLSTLDSALATYKGIQNSLNDTLSVLPDITDHLNYSIKLLSYVSTDFTTRYSSFRYHISSYFSSSELTLIVSQIIICISVVGCLISIITIRLIQAKFDFFSLKTYKIIWACHIIVFCLNLVFLLIFNQMLLYGQGACLVAQKVLSNTTLMHELIPTSASYSGLGLLASCMGSKPDFSVITSTSNQFSQFANLTRLKQQLYENYTVNTVSGYSAVINDLKSALTSYKIGVKGKYAYLDQLLCKINKILLKNPYSDYCFKHHWQFTVSNCTAGQAIIVLPKKPFNSTLNNTNYASSSSVCYILSNYDSASPYVINFTSFVNLYSNYPSRCNASLNALQDLLASFFGAESTKQSVISNLISQVSTTIPYLKNSTYYFAQYIDQRKTFFDAVFKNLTQDTNYAYLSSGHSCGIIGSMIQGIYNQFCINYRAQGRQVYLITFCNLAYSVFLVLLSFLYSLQLQSINQEDDKDNTNSQRFQFSKSNGLTLHESQGSLADLESHSRKSQQQK